MWRAKDLEDLFERGDCNAGGEARGNSCVETVAGHTLRGMLHHVSGEFH